MTRPPHLTDVTRPLRLPVLTMLNPDEQLTTMRMIRYAGISYRQATHWTVKGYLRPVPQPPEQQGTGYQRFWMPGEAEIARRMRLMIAAGLTVEAAARYAREWPGRCDDLIVLLDGMGRKS